MKKLVKLEIGILFLNKIINHRKKSNASFCLLKTRPVSWKKKIICYWLWLTNE